MIPDARRRPVPAGTVVDDLHAVVAAPAFVRRARVLSRGTPTRLTASFTPGRTSLDDPARTALASVETIHPRVR
jgi:hypothetical protein